MPSSEELDYLWRLYVYGYLLVVVIETPILLVGLSPRHSIRRRLFAGVWLNACSYPIVILVLPLLIDHHETYLAVAEVFAPVAECALFWLAFGERREWLKAPMWRDFAVIAAANLVSFGAGLVLLKFEIWPFDVPRP